MPKSERRKIYERNKAAKVGAEIICPICGQKFVKKQYSQAFCCGKCKDDFWNTKGDRHRKGYYRDYDEKHLERIERALDLGYYDNSIVCVIGKGLTPSAERDLYEDELENVLVSRDCLDDDFYGGDFVEND